MNFSSTTGYTINKNPGAFPNGSISTDSSKTGTAGGVSSSNNLNSFTETLSAEFTAYTNNGWLMAASFDYTYTYTHSKTFIRQRIPSADAEHCQTAVQEEERGAPVNGLRCAGQEYFGV